MVSEKHTQVEILNKFLKSQEDVDFFLRTGNKLKGTVLKFDKDGVVIKNSKGTYCIRRRDIAAFGSGAGE